MSTGTAKTKTGIRNASGEDINPATAEGLTDGTQQTKITDGTNSVNIVQNVSSSTNTDGLYGASVVASMFGRVDDSTVKGVCLDPSTESQIFVAYPHHEIHGGDHYYIQGYVELDNADTYYIKLVTPDTTTWSHFMFDIKSTGICTTYLDEDATGGMTGGTSVTPLNNNRNSANTSGMTLTAGVTAATSYTTRLESDKWGADGFKQTVGGGGGREHELILKQGTTYLRTFVSGADGNIIQFRATWYEHADKN